jgi:hypothetical protein
MTVAFLIVLSALFVGALCVWLLLHARRPSTHTRARRNSTSSDEPIRTAGSSPSDALELTTSPTANADALILGDVDNPLIQIMPSDVSEATSAIEVNSSMLSTLADPLLRPR